MKKGITLLNKVCKQCEKKFIVSLSCKKQKFCCKKCFGKYNNGINNPFYGKKHSLESLKKMSESRKGRKLSEEWKRKIGESNKGKKYSLDTRKKMSESHKGKKLSLETRKKMSEVQKKGKYLNCKICNKEFWAIPTQIKNGRKYCSIRCSSSDKDRVYERWNSGKKMSEEFKKKISEGCRKRFKKLGYINSPEARKKISKSKRGEKSHFWKGGIAELTDRIRHLPKSKNWKLGVFQRDNFTCQMPDCNKTAKILNAHHIKEFSLIIEENNIKTIEQALDCQELWTLKNGITLCKKCHNSIRHHELKYQPIFINIINNYANTKTRPITNKG